MYEIDIFSPIQQFADFITYNLLNIASGSHMGNAVNFFIYDVIKIGLLLIIINYIMSITRYIFPIEKVRDMLTKRRWFGLDYLFAALLGVVTPFCSCSSIPLFIGFVSVRIPLGITFAFLISSPLINEASLYLFPTIFGLTTTIIYNVLGIIIAIAGGMVIQKIHPEKYINKDLMGFISKKQIEKENGEEPLPLKKLLSYWWHDGWSITRQVFPYVVLGVGIGAIIHGYVPANLIENYLSSKAWWIVPVAVLIGSPLYANSMGVIPIIEALAGKGVPFGTLMAFMTTVVAVSLPEIIILKKVMKWQLLATFIGITLIGAMMIGYVFNFLL
ncbi:permease [Thermoproteota archaeon]